MRYVRIICQPVNAPDQNPITVDAVLDEKDEILGRHSLFGLWGRIDQDQAYFSPLVLRGDGLIDYGNAFDPATDRYFAFDLRSGPVTVNRQLTYKSRDRATVVNYIIDQVLDLPPGAPVG